MIAFQTKGETPEFVKVYASLWVLFLDSIVAIRKGILCRIFSMKQSLKML